LGKISATAIYPADTSTSIEWIPDDLKPGNYEIYLNGSLIQTGIWNSTGIELALDGLQPVPVDITLVISIGSIVVIVVIVGVICRSKGQGTPGVAGAGYTW